MKNGYPQIVNIVTKQYEEEPFTDVSYYSYKNGEYVLEVVLSVYSDRETVWTRNQAWKDLPVPGNPIQSQTAIDGSIWWDVITPSNENFFENDFTEYNRILLGLTGVKDFVYNGDALFRLKMSQMMREVRRDEAHNGGSTTIHQELSEEQ